MNINMRANITHTLDSFVKRFVVAETDILKINVDKAAYSYIVHRSKYLGLNLADKMSIINYYKTEKRRYNATKNTRFPY